MSLVHQLKTDPKVFALSWHGKKPWEIRLNDRDFKKGDVLNLKETKFSGEEMLSGNPLEYTGYSIDCEVVAIVSGYGLNENWVVMTVKQLKLKTPRDVY